MTLAVELQEYFYCSSCRVFQDNSSTVFKNSVVGLSVWLLFHSDKINEKWFPSPNKILEEKKKINLFFDNI